jgi:hypothetical protein
MLICAQALAVAHSSCQLCAGQNFSIAWISSHRKPDMSLSSIAHTASPRP